MKRKLSDLIRVLRRSVEFAVYFCHCHIFVSKMCFKVQQACNQYNFRLALDIESQKMVLHGVLFVEPGPGGVKFASLLLGLCKDDLRLPMVKLQ